MSTIFKKNIKYIHMIVAFFLMAGIGLLPPIGEITKVGMEVLGIFVGLLYAWIFCGMLWPSLLGLLMLGLSDYSTVTDALASGFGHPTVMFLFFLYIFCGAIDESGLMEVVGQFLVSLKIAQGKPYVMMFLLVFAAWLIGGVVSAVASVVLIWKVFSEICGYLEYKKGGKYATLTIIGIFMAAMVGSAMFPFKVYGVLMLGVYESITGTAIDFLQYTILCMSVSFCIITAYVFVCKLFIRPQVSDKVIVVERPKQLTGKQKKIAALLIGMVAAYFFPSIFPSEWRLIQLLNDLGTAGIMAIVVILCMIIHDNEKPLLEIKKAIHRGMSWEIYFLLMVVFPLSTAIASDTTGISSFVSDKLGVIFEGQSAFMFCFLTLAIGMLLSNVISNGVTPVIMLSIMIPIAAQLGINDMMLTCLLSVSMMTIILLPSGSPVVGLLINNDWVTRSDIYKYGAVILIISIAILTLIGIPLGNIVF